LFSEHIKFFTGFGIKYSGIILLEGNYMTQDINDKNSEKPKILIPENGKPTKLGPYIQTTEKQAGIGPYSNGANEDTNNTLHMTC
jgi:hypothetical protein